MNAKKLSLLIVIFSLLLASVACASEKATSTSTRPVMQGAATRRPTSTHVPTPETITQDNAEGIARRAISRTEGASAAMIEGITYASNYNDITDGIIISYRMASFNLGGVQSGIDDTRELFPRMICSLRVQGFDKSTIVLHALAEVTDDFGASSTDSLVKVVLSPETGAKIRCDNLANVNIFSIADDLELAPALINSIDAQN